MVIHFLPFLVYKQIYRLEVVLRQLENKKKLIFIMIYGN
jgi:hypothetical protein